MSRSIWKGPYLDPFLWKKIYNNLEDTSKSLKRGSLKIWSRRSVILPYFVGKTVEVHQGKNFIRLLITEDMIGHKFGEFALTRKLCDHKKLKKNK
jgi:small subunit ribosomal protein S19